MGDANRGRRGDLGERLTRSLNRAINLQLRASYVYLSIYSFFSRGTVALPGFARYFRELSDDEFGAGTAVLDYLVRRGGEAALEEIEQPRAEGEGDWQSSMHVFRECLAMAEDMRRAAEAALRDAGGGADDGDADADATEFLERHLLQRHSRRAREFGDMVARLERAGPRIGVYLIDSQMAKKGQDTTSNQSA